ncbi:MAG TPA: hypothetical protein VEB21_13100 [Terriglobales bacterium]|nr:hypothetical protein [Terriglobales bacterium]
MKAIRLLATTLLLFTAIQITGCRRDDGPAERAGEKIDEAVDEAEDKVD